MTVESKHTGCFRNDPEYPDPEQKDIESERFEAVWNAIKTWDISRFNDGLYSGPTGNDVMHILRALDAIKEGIPAS